MTEPMKCPACGSDDQTGNYCAGCGAALRLSCEACGAGLPPDSRFCTQCGQRAGGRSWGRLAWPLAGAAVVLLLLLLALPRYVERAGPRTMTTPGAASDRSAPPPLSGDMRVDAERLFNRVMAARERGDAAEAARFTPMAVQAYGMVGDLDADGLYHLALLHLSAGDYAASQQAAARILEGAPDHVLALGVAGAAAAAAGDGARAAALYRRLLEVYAEEAARSRPEYADHQGMLAEYRRAAREHLGDASD